MYVCCYLSQTAIRPQLFRGWTTLCISWIIKCCSVSNSVNDYCFIAFICSVGIYPVDIAIQPLIEQAGPDLSRRIFSVTLFED